MHTTTSYNEQKKTISLHKHACNKRSAALPQLKKICLKKHMNTAELFIKTLKRRAGDNRATYRCGSMSESKGDLRRTHSLITPVAPPPAQVSFPGHFLSHTDGVFP